MPIHQNLLSFLKTWTHFSKREERVGFSLVICTVLVMLLPRWLRMYKEENNPNAFTLELIPEEKNKAALKQSHQTYSPEYKYSDSKHSDYKHSEYSDHSHSDQKHSNFKHSDNNYSDYKHSNYNHENYKHKNADFSQKQNKRSNEKPYSSTHENLEKINIQTANVETWARLKGIGPVLSARIVKYRDLLGGFYSTQQLKEVYGVSEETYEMIKDQIILSKGSKEKGLTTLALEKLDFKTCLKHPYIGYDGAKAIDTWRKKHEEVEAISKEDLILLLGAEKAKKIEPYVK